MKDVHSLQVSHEAHQLTLDVYRITTGFPREEMYGQAGQLRGASASLAKDLKLIDSNEHECRPRRFRS